jgi:hypothetical protein
MDERSYFDYVGLYPNCTEVPSGNADFRIFKFYDKTLVVSYIPIEMTNTPSRRYNNLIVELDNDITGFFDFEQDPMATSDFIRGVIDDLIFLMTEHKIVTKKIDNGSYVISSPVQSFINNDRYEHYFMNYLKINFDGNKSEKFYNVQFFKLNDDCIELLEVD